MTTNEPTLDALLSDVPSIVEASTMLDDLLNPLEAKLPQELFVLFAVTLSRKVTEYSNESAGAVDDLFFKKAVFDCLPIINSCGSPFVALASLLTVARDLRVQDRESFESFLCIVAALLETN